MIPTSRGFHASSCCLNDGPKPTRRDPRRLVALTTTQYTYSRNVLKISDGLLAIGDRVKVKIVLP